MATKAVRMRCERCSEDTGLLFTLAVQEVPHGRALHERQEVCEMSC